MLDCIHIVPKLGNNPRPAGSKPAQHNTMAELPYTVYTDLGCQPGVAYAACDGQFYSYLWWPDQVWTELY